MRQLLKNNGFTFIELIIVFTILTILGSIGIASFSNYSNSQQLRNTSADLVNLLQSARSGSLSQAQSSFCTAQNQSFAGYDVQFCSKTNLCTNNNYDYELDVVCTGSIKMIQYGIFPKGTGKVTLDSATSQNVFYFLAISGIATNGKIVLDGYQNQQKTITVSTTGIISQQ